MVSSTTETVDDQLWSSKQPSVELSTRQMERVGHEVLAFYRDLPFNYRVAPNHHADAIRSKNQLLQYSPLVHHLKPKTSLLDVGCGAGWLSLSAAWHYGCQVTGIDFNPVAVERARAVAEILSLPVSFSTADLFQFEAQTKFEIVTSIGVLHHTNDCLGAISRICSNFVQPGGHLFIGLYHRYGRKPFLDHFRQLRASGASEEEMLEDYRRLHPLDDETHLRSWFRDQVLHPHETQHTLAEMLPVLQDAGMTLTSTSINRFGPIDDPAAVAATEDSLRDVGEQRLKQGRYFPGFFVFLARKG